MWQYTFFNPLMASGGCIKIVANPRWLKTRPGHSGGRHLRLTSGKARDNFKCPGW
jgi:hypothetical protein